MALTFNSLPDDFKAAIQRVEHCAAAVAVLETKLERANAEATAARGRLAELLGEVIGEGPF